MHILHNVKHLAYSKDNILQLNIDIYLLWQGHQIHSHFGIIISPCLDVLLKIQFFVGYKYTILSVFKRNK